MNSKISKSRYKLFDLQFRNVNSDVTPEECFDLYMQFGSLAKVSKNLRSRGKLKYMGRDLHPITISVLIWKWCLENPEESFVRVNKHMEISRETWETILVSKAWSIFYTRLESIDRYYDWLKRNGLYEKYKDFKKPPKQAYQEYIQKQMSC